MGQYFMISKRFNKQTPGDFGLINANQGDCAIRPTDNSKWVRCSLYDWGWGSEIGYYRIPLPCFSELLQILTESNDADDMYGAAAIIMEKYPNELLGYCEEIFSQQVDKELANKLIKTLRLDQCINHSSIEGKSFEEIRNDFIRWQEVCKKARNLIKNH